MKYLSVRCVSITVVTEDGSPNCTHTYRFRYVFADHVEEQSVFQVCLFTDAPDSVDDQLSSSDSAHGYSLGTVT